MCDMNNQVSVIGAGTMGTGIAQLLAQKGITVNLIDKEQDILNQAENKIKAQLKALEHEGLLDKFTVSNCLERINLSTKITSVSGSWLVIEAVPEQIELKRAVLKQLEGLCAISTIFATNTSGISVNEIAKGLKHPERLIGTHFFMPAAIIPLVEVVKGEETTEPIITKVVNFLRDMGKYPVLIKKEVPGFIANRIQHAITREAISLLEKGIATAEDIDTVVRWSIGVRLAFTGPLEQRDLNGLDVHHDIASYLYKDLENRTEPSPLLTQKVAQGDLGIKTGRGFYDWEGRDIAIEDRLRNSQLLHLISWLNSRGKEEDSIGEDN